MSSPESEWMLWAMRLKTSIQAEFNVELQSLHTCCAKLEQATASIDTLKIHIEELTASNEHLHHANISLQDRIREVESEAAINLAQQVQHVVKNFEQLQKQSKAAEEKQQRQHKDWMQQTEGLKLNAGVEGRGEAVLKTLSEATTIDDGPDEAVGPPEGFYHPQQSDGSISQGKATYQEYLLSGERFIQNALRESEARAVKAYIQGMRQRFRRKPVWDALEGKGWTWENARHEIQMIIDEGKRRRQNRRTIQLPPLGKID
ncbi:MAG: hypothetical protein Q9166_004471 [cf. Caloplaca sp. 2 TL-2023]